MKLLFKTILAIALILSQEAYCQTADDEGRFKEFWKKFARVVQSGDTAAFKRLSLDTLQCPDCVEDLLEEDDELYYKRQYMSVEIFLFNYFNKIFDSNIVQRLNDSSKVSFSIQQLSSQEFLEKHSQKNLVSVLTEQQFKNSSVGVVVADPTINWEGASFHLDFVETKNGFKLYSMYLVP